MKNLTSKHRFAFLVISAWAPNDMVRASLEKSSRWRRRSVGVVMLAFLGTYGCSKAPEPSSGPSVEISTGDEIGSTYLPASDARNALSELKLAQSDNSVVSLRIRLFPANSVFAGLATADKPVPIPFQARRQIVLQVRADLGTEELTSLFEKFAVEPVRVLPEIGVVVVQVPDSHGEQPVATVQDLRDVEHMELFKLVGRLAQDPRVLTAVPNSVLSTFQIRPSFEAVSVNIPAAGMKDEQEDWGIKDANIADVWPRLTSDSLIGVIDVGFSAHDDLKMRKGLPAPIAKNNHGNHVSGIMCAQHNKIAVRGVLKNCTVVYASSQNILAQVAPIQGSDVYAWSSFFTEYIASVLDFIRVNPDVKVINLSLGYNWLPNFNKDPRLEAQMRNIIQGQGRIYLSMLEIAADKDIAIVSAAGNDSDELDKPLEAKWASPFNFGANLMQLTRGWSNALVVEAHDRNGERASFSNVGGDISCPGVDILSTTAESATSVQLMSGTSMASPYCAAGLSALRTILPSIKLKNAMRCIRKSPRFSGTVPMLDLNHAISNCSNNEAAIASEEREETIKRWSAFLSGNSAMPSAATTSSCRYGMRREFRVTAVADLGDGQGPEFSDPKSLQEVRAYAAELVASGCRDPVLIAMRFGFDPANQQRMNFAMAIMSEFYKAKYPGGVALVEYPQFGDFGDLEGFTDRVVVLVSDPDFRGKLIGGA